MTSTRPGVLQMRVPCNQQPEATAGRRSDPTQVAAAHGRSNFRLQSRVVDSVTDANTSITMAHIVCARLAKGQSQTILVLSLVKRADDPDNSAYLG